MIDEQRAWEELVEWVQKQDGGAHVIYSRLRLILAKDAECKRLREELRTGLAMTTCPVCGSETANTNESRLNKENRRLREDLWLLLDYFQINEKFITEHRRRRAEGKE